MGIETLRNKAAASITKEDFELALEELHVINSSITDISYIDVSGVLHIKFTITLDSGAVTEQLRFGQFVNLVETGLSTVEKLIEAGLRDKLRLKKSESARKAKATREAKKPENNITKNGEKVSFIELISGVKENANNSLFGQYEKRFIESIMNQLASTKKKLTSKQHNFLCDVAEKLGYTMPKKSGKATKARKPAVIHCDHEDLGSLGYTHGDIVKCPHCGQAAEVW